MRKVLLIATLVAFGAAGVAYGATVVTNVYVVSAKITPAKSGTKAHPKSIGTTIAYTVTTKPSGDRPNVVKTVQTTVPGIQAHGNDFPACSTSRLTSTGPSSCPKGSQVGTGYFIAEIGSASSQSGQQLTCRVELSVYNGGGNTLSYYVFENPAEHSSVAECPTQSPTAFAATVRQTAAGLVQTLNIPLSVRHPGNNTAIDASVIKATVSISAKSRKLKHKTVGLTESISCPVNHERTIKVKFTLENGKSQLVTRNVACK